MTGPRNAAGASPAAMYYRRMRISPLAAACDVPLAWRRPEYHRILNRVVDGYWLRGDLVHVRAEAPGGQVMVAGFVRMENSAWWRPIGAFAEAAFAAWDGTWRLPASHLGGPVAAWLDGLQPLPDQPDPVPGVMGGRA
ncbi:MAG: hypothetical protein ACRDXX_09945 [Stackebrandtia sp.]